MNPIVLKKNGFENRVDALADGIAKALPTGTNLVVNKANWSSAQITEKLQGYLKLFADVQDAKAGVSQKLGTLHQGLTEAHQFVTGCVKALEAYFGKGNAELTQFGISLGARRSLTSDQKSIAKAKGQQTRVVRHTLGRKQRLTQGVTPPTVVVLGPDGKPISSATLKTATVGSPAPGTNVAVGSVVAQPSGSDGAGNTPKP